MAMDRLPDSVQGAPSPPLQFCWRREDGQPQRFDDVERFEAVLRAQRTGLERPAVGTIRVDGDDLEWLLDEEDVRESGFFLVQITAHSPEEPSPARNYIAEWYVRPALGETGN